MIEVLYHIGAFRKLVFSRSYGSNGVVTALQRIFYQMQLGSQPISTELLLYRANLLSSKNNLYETDWLLSSLLSNLASLEHGGKALFLEPSHIVCELTPSNVLEGLKRHFSHKSILVDNHILPSVLRAYITAKSIPAEKKSVFPLTLPLSKFAPVKDHENTLYHLFAVVVGDGNEHFYSYLKPFGLQDWFKLDGDPVETKVQTNTANNTITFFGEAHDKPPNCICNQFYLELAALISADLLFYVKDVEATSLLTDVATTHHSAALKKGMRDLVDEYDPYILLKVYVDEDFTSFFGLVNEDVPIREFEVKCTKTLKEFKSIVHTEFGVSVDQQLFWVVEAEDDGQKRPQRAIPPVDEEFPLGDLAETSVVLELYLQDLKNMSSTVACKEMLLFLKFYDPTTQTLRYYGSAVFKGRTKIAQVAEQIHQIMGSPFANGVKLWLYEEVSPECITLLHPESSLNEAELSTGGIIIFQRSVPSEARRELAYPTAPDFCDWILNRVHITLRPLDDTCGSEVSMEIHKNVSYDNFAQQVSRRLSIPAPKLVFFVFKYESSVTQISIPLSRELYPSVMSDLGTYRYSIYYVEQKPSPAELRDHTLSMRVWWYDYFNTPVKEICFELSADASVANVLQYIKSSVKLDPEQGTGRVRLMVLSNSHIMHVFEDDEKLANFAYPPLSYLRAEEEYKEENIIDTDANSSKFVEVMQIFYSEGMVMAGDDPFLLCIHTGELFGSLKERVQRRLKIPVEDFKKCRVIMHNNSGKPVHIPDDHPLTDADLNDYKYLAIYSAKLKQLAAIANKGESNMGNTNIIANISETIKTNKIHDTLNQNKIRLTKAQTSKPTDKPAKDSNTNNNNEIDHSNNHSNDRPSKRSKVGEVSEATETTDPATETTSEQPTGKHKNKNKKKGKKKANQQDKDVNSVKNVPTESSKADANSETSIETNNTATETTPPTATSDNTSDNELLNNAENVEIPEEVQDVIGKRLTRNAASELFWKKKNEEVLLKVKEEEEKLRSRQKEQIQVRMAEAEKYAKLREERLQKKLEETVKKEERRRQEEEELFDIEQEIEEIRKRDIQMEDERKRVERDIMVEEEVIRKELENRKKEIDIMTNFINMKDNACKWLEETKSSANKEKETTAPTKPEKPPAPANDKSKKKNYGIEKIERYFKEIKYEDIITDAPKVRLGQGATSKVLKGIYLGQEVAIKKFNGNFDSILPKVRMEIALLSELRHPHIILLIGACTQPSRPLCVVTEYMKNGSLFDVMHERKVTLPLYIKLSIAKDIARGINFLHKSNPICIHRDLNSKNILLDEYFRAKLADFGISRLVSSTTPAVTCQLGSSEWSAPEMLMGDDYTHKVDSYSYAVVLWELFTGQVPYGSLGLSPIQIGMRVLTKGLRPTPLPPVDTCPPLIMELIQKCWDLDPNKRLEFDIILECLNAVIIDPSPAVSLASTSSNDKSKQGKADECKICFAAKINTCLVPCGHLCVCSECAEVITRDNHSKGGNCPICRLKIQKVVITYQS